MKFEDLLGQNMKYFTFAKHYKGEENFSIAATASPASICQPNLLNYFIPSELS